jgi:OOP family OmpA-OmpF porin
LSNKVAAAFIPEMHFSTNSASLSSEDEAKLAVVAKMMRANPSLRLCVIGHTDKTGSERVNLRVGERRAKSVVRSLTTIFKISEARFEIKSKGESELLSTKNNHNRRVEFQFIK